METLLSLIIRRRGTMGLKEVLEYFYAFIVRVDGQILWWLGLGGDLFRLGRGG